MKLPSLLPVVCFAGGILLSGNVVAYLRLTPRICILAILVALLFAYVLLQARWILTAAILGAAAWMCLGVAAATLERASVSPNLASTLIEAGKIDASTALRWRGRLRGDPLQLPWGTRYEIALDQVESGAGVTPVTGGLRLTSYRDESNGTAPLAAGAGDEVECLSRAHTIRNFGNPGGFDYREFLARQDVQLEGSLRSDQLLTIVGSPHVTISDRVARVRGRLLNSVDELLASRPDAVVVRLRVGGWGRWAAAIPFLVAAALIATHPFAPNLAGNKLELTVLDVGQGDSLFLAFPGGHTMLVDGGGDLTSFYSGGMRSGIDIGEEVVSPYLWSRGIKKIDVVALTHAHQDHLGGLPAILQNFRVGELWVGRDIQSAAYRHVLAIARERGVRILHRKQGESFNLDGVSGSILWPDNLFQGQTANNNDSLVIRLTDGSQSFLLAGDIERPSERKMLAEDQTVAVNFLKVAHHGSKTSTIDPFLSAAHPGFAAISVGKDNSFGHPSPEVIDRLQAAGIRVYRTDLDGAITATTNGRTLGVSTFVNPIVPGNARFIAGTP